MSLYYRPLAQIDSRRPEDALTLAGGWAWCERVEVLSRGAPARIVAARDLPGEVAERLAAPRPPLAGGLSMDRPRLMAILNVTPDSFSDGGMNSDMVTALGRALQFDDAGADIIDIGGESTRPGAAAVAPRDEIDRVAPLIGKLLERRRLCLSLDTRRAEVARMGIEAGVCMVNDVSGFTHDPGMIDACAPAASVSLCVMHGPFDPAEMQKNPTYDDVLLDVYDFLEARVTALEAAGVARGRIVVDPGIGFGKTLEHNLALLRGVSLFHGLGCPVMLGASRKGFIGTLAGQPEARLRAPGSIAVGLAALAQGVQILRVHDVVETRQAVTLWQAATGAQA